MKSINKDNIATVLDFLADKYRLFAPQEQENFTVNFTQMTPGQKPQLDFYNSQEPPKKIFFPQSEVLFSYSKQGEQTVPDPQDQKPCVVFGMRPCDARSLALLDMVFDAADCQDPYYAARRRNTTIFVLACNRPQQRCFCTSFDFGPFSGNHGDVLVVDVGEKYLFDAITDKGTKIMAELPGLQEAQAADTERIAPLKADAEARIVKRVDLAGLAEKLTTMEDHPIWQELAQKCLGCRVCSFMCPTCHCFDMIDEPGADGGQRLRIWDTCMSPDFTHEASGHNPRSDNIARMRQRIMHKFNYFVANNGEFACVGCGRCTRDCSPGTDLTRTIERIHQAKTENQDE